MLEHHAYAFSPHVRRPPLRLARRATRIVLAEADGRRRKRMAGLLRQAGYRVIEVTRGADVVRHLDLRLTDAGPMADVDLIIANVQMPDTSGVEVLRELRSVDWATAVILIGDDISPRTAAAARYWGAAAVLPTTVRGPLLVDAVRSVAPADA